jgi:hypothetical protein
MTAELLADFEQWAQLTEKLAAYSDAFVTRVSPGPSAVPHRPLDARRPAVGRVVSDGAGDSD